MNLLFLILIITEECQECSLKMTKLKLALTVSFAFLIQGKSVNQWVEDIEFGRDNLFRGYLHCDMVWKPSYLVPLIPRLEELPVPVPLPGNTRHLSSKNKMTTAITRSMSNRWHLRMPLYMRKGYGSVIS